MKFILAIAALLGLVAVAATPARCQGTVLGQAQVDYPSSTTTLRGPTHGYIQVNVTIDGWVTIAGAAANGIYSISTQLSWGVTGWWAQYAGPVGFDVICDANGNGTVDPDDDQVESGTNNVGVQGGSNPYSAFGYSQVIQSDGLTVGHPNPYVASVTFTIVGS